MRDTTLEGDIFVWLFAIPVAVLFVVATAVVWVPAVTVWLGARWLAERIAGRRGRHAVEGFGWVVLILLGGLVVLVAALGWLQDPMSWFAWWYVPR